MNLKQLEAFVKVTESGSFSKAPNYKWGVEKPAL